MFLVTVNFFFFFAFHTYGILGGLEIPSQHQCLDIAEHCSPFL